MTKTIFLAFLMTLQTTQLLAKPVFNDFINDISSATTILRDYEYPDDLFWYYPEFVYDYCVDENGRKKFSYVESKSRQNITVSFDLCIEERLSDKELNRTERFISELYPNTNIRPFEVSRVEILRIPGNIGSADVSIKCEIDQKTFVKSCSFSTDCPPPLFDGPSKCDRIKRLLIDESAEVTAIESVCLIDGHMKDKDGDGRVHQTLVKYWCNALIYGVQDQTYYKLVD
ncbi:MAG: hypothetical protein KDD34_07800 [Bdellovibrionales bacterium]|nr:hypothetical protein [Bdellovibrionales bacterium]